MAAEERVPAAASLVVAARPLPTDRSSRQKRNWQDSSHFHLPTARASGEVLVRAMVALATLQIVTLYEVLNAGFDCHRAGLESPAQLSRRLRGNDQAEFR